LLQQNGLQLNIKLLKNKVLFYKKNKVQFYNMYVEKPVVFSRNFWYLSLLPPIAPTEWVTAQYKTPKNYKFLRQKGKFYGM
jgi:hypothetical protein